MGIVALLEVAKSSVPMSMWNATPVVLKATAGLRLLPGEKAKHLLDKVRQHEDLILKGRVWVSSNPFLCAQVRALFLESPFLSRDDSVSIMDGTDEGRTSSLLPLRGC